MSQLWPHLPDAVAAHDFDRISDGVRIEPSVRHPGQIYAPVGDRVSEMAVQRLVEETTALAGQHGYPDPANSLARIEFDRAAALLIREAMDITWAEGGNRNMWSFTSLVALPHLTLWRFGTGNRERWVASDLTRHTWSRLWWQAVVFEKDTELLKALSESDLNQLLERRSIGGDVRLVHALGQAIVDVSAQDVPRRFVIRDATARLRRWLAFVDVHALDDQQIHQMCRSLTMQTVQRFNGET